MKTSTWSILGRCHVDGIHSCPVFFYRCLAVVILSTTSPPSPPLSVPMFLSWSFLQRVCLIPDIGWIGRGYLVHFFKPRHTIHSNKKRRKPEKKQSKKSWVDIRVANTLTKCMIFLYVINPHPRRVRCASSLCLSLCQCRVSCSVGVLCAYLCYVLSAIAKTMTPRNRRHDTL